MEAEGFVVSKVWVAVNNVVLLSFGSDIADGLGQRMGADSACRVVAKSERTLFLYGRSANNGGLNRMRILNRRKQDGN